MNWLSASTAKTHPFWLAALMLLVGALTTAPAFAGRIKEIAAVQGVRTNQLTGFGLVVGLDGTGDQTTQMPYTSQGLNNYLQQLGITLPAASISQLQLKNVAAVLVTAQLPAFARPGQTMDVNVSSVGNSKSLKGGMLITTPLKGGLRAGPRQPHCWRCRCVCRWQQGPDQSP
jgi:flagellar P-ring protein precursor FlgI